MKERLNIFEVGLRDGLQNQPVLIGVEGKKRLFNALRAAGLTELEVTSFVSPKAVPQMADAGEVIAHANLVEGGRNAALVINRKGYDRAIAGGAKAISLVVVVTETLSQRNSRMSVEDALVSARDVLRQAGADRVHRRVYIAPAFVCPYEGQVSKDAVLRAADQIWEAGCDELAIADTIGHADPFSVGRMFATLTRRFGRDKLAAHLHDTQAMGLANAAAAMSEGIRTIDAAVGGLGGCPFAPGAAGNLATEDIVLMAEKMGFETGVDLTRLYDAVDVASELVGKTVGGRTAAWWRGKFRDGNKCA